MTVDIPFIPDNAPFTPEQRAWLNGMIAGMFSATPAPVNASTKPSHRIAVLYASQSGTAEGLARKTCQGTEGSGSRSRQFQRWWVTPRQPWLRRNTLCS